MGYGIDNDDIEMDDVSEGLPMVPKNEKFLIQCETRTTKCGVLCWWKPEAKGYTYDINDAGRYTQQHAEQIKKGANDIQIYREISVVSGEVGKVRRVVMT